jgi:ATP-binding cassette subfamily B (MDR/TAP) protein 1
MAKLVAILAVVPLTVIFFENLFFGYASQRVGNRIKLAYFTAITRQEIGLFDIKKAGTFTNAISDDVNKVTDLFSTNMQNICQFTAQIIAGVVIALTSNWTMALLQMIAFPLIITLFLVSGNILKYFSRKSSMQLGDSVATANEVISSMRTVRSMAGDEKEMARYGRNLQKVRTTGFFFSLVKGISIWLAGFFNVSFSFSYIVNELVGSCRFVILVRW